MPLGWLAVALGGLAAMGCIASPDEEVSELGEPAFHENALTQNALTQNALTQNALTQNALTQNALTQNALTQNALTQNALTQNALEDPDARELFAYIVSCALPASSELVYTDAEGTSHVFPGGLGLAPEWGEPGGKCGAGCRHWVSACVLSRVNYLGQPTSISVRGALPALAATWAEYQTYTFREATYFGNIFSTPQRLLACLPPGQTQAPRVCGPSIEDCAIDFVGSCQKACSGVTKTGAYHNCRGPSDHAPNKTMTYQGSITVFLP